MSLDGFRSNTVAEKRVDFGYNALGQFTSIACYKDTDGGTGNEVATSNGNVTGGDTSLTRYLFTSRELDADTGLQYNRARWYDPQVGRWISEDPLEFVAGDANVARYVGNGVTNWFDPSGLEPPPNDKDWVYHIFDKELKELAKLEKQTVKSITPKPVVFSNGGGRPVVSLDFEPFPREHHDVALHSTIDNIGVDDIDVVLEISF